MAFEETNSCTRGPETIERIVSYVFPMDSDLDLDLLPERPYWLVDANEVAYDERK